MANVIGFIVVVVLFVVIPKMTEANKRNAMCDEINNRAKEGVETDINKSIDLHVKLWNGEITKNQYYDMQASGYTRKEKK